LNDSTLPSQRCSARQASRHGPDARLATDLSTLTSESLTTSNEQFYVRTARPAAIGDPRPGRSLARSHQAAARLGLGTLLPRAEIMGTYLLECSGNTDPNNFGLMSAASWRGIPMSAVFDRVEPAAAAEPGARQRRR